MRADLERQSQLRPEITGYPRAASPCRVGEPGECKVGRRKTASVALANSGVATGAAPLAIAAARFFGLDAGDWSMILRRPCTINLAAGGYLIRQFAHDVAGTQFIELHSLQQLSALALSDSVAFPKA